MSDAHEAPANGIRILPGQWRPDYPAEQIAWISPPWPGEDCIWLDFPEAVFCAGRLLYLSHISAHFKAEYEDLPKAEWQVLPDGIAFDRALPNGIQFGGSLTVKDLSAVAMELHMTNGSSEPLTDIKLQTCAYLRAIREFADLTNDNKFVHVPASGWVSLAEAIDWKEEAGSYRIGWRSGPAAADLPVMVTASNQAERLSAITWYEDTYALIGNPDHPCMHADPYFGDLAPGQSASIHGEIIFFEGTLDEFEDHWQSRERNA